MQLPQNTRTESNTLRTSLWTKRFIVSLTFLVWLVFAGVFIWFVGQTVQAFLLLTIGAILAYTIYPLVHWFERIMPRPLAITLVYLIVLGLLVALLYLIVVTFIDQVKSLIQYTQGIVNGDETNQLQPVLDTLHRFGITQDQLRNSGQQLLGQLRGVASSVVPVISNVFSVFLNTILVAMLSIYFLGSGPRAARWLREKTPLSQRSNIHFLLDTLSRVIAGYVRGTVLLATVISTLTGIGIALIGVPYSFLIAVVAFVLSFIPIIGIYITSAAVILVALTKGWTTALLAIAIVLLLQLLENNVLNPRIVGRAVGINPIVSIFALIAGTNLFGVAGAFFAAPLAGVIQILIQAFWSRWREQHAEEFPEKQRSDPHSEENEQLPTVPIGADEQRS